MIIPLSILDLAPIRPGVTASDSFAASVALARRAEECGYRRVWYAEHHNNPMIASSAPSVLIAHIAPQTREIRLGAGGVMLPNHAPLVIAEQFGTLEALHPGRIDLGLGRAPGADQNTVRALRRYAERSRPVPPGRHRAAGLSGRRDKDPRRERRRRDAARRFRSTFSARRCSAPPLAAALGLPYAFASHFAPAELHAAVAAYRREFRPSAQLEEPYVIAGVNVIAADTSAEAQRQFLAAQRHRASALLGRGRILTGDEADAILASPAGQHIQQMAVYSAVGTPAEVSEYIAAFVEHADADELMVAHQSPGTEARLRSVQLLADCVRVRDRPAAAARCAPGPRRR